MILRKDKTTPLTHAELDGNFEFLNNLISDLSAGSFSGSYNDLTNKPILSIDELVSRMGISSITYNGDGSVATMLYENVYKSIYTYNSGKLSKVEYTDTDKVTILLTETFTYDVSGNLLTTTRS